MRVKAATMHWPPLPSAVPSTLAAGPPEMHWPLAPQVAASLTMHAAGGAAITPMHR